MQKPAKKIMINVHQVKVDEFAFFFFKQAIESGTNFSQ